MAPAVRHTGAINLTREGIGVAVRLGSFAGVLVACLLVAGCAPLPAPSSPVASGSTPTTSASAAVSSRVPPAPTTSSPSPSGTTPALPAATVSARWPIPATALAVEEHWIWYLRGDASGGVIGRLDPESGTRIERPAGPAPVAIASTPEAVFLLEGMPDTGSPNGPRSNAIERLDRETLAVLDSAPVSVAPTALAVVDDEVLVGGIRGSLQAFAASNLGTLWTITLPGHGSSSLAASTGAAWLLDGAVEDGAYLLNRVVTADGAPTGPAKVPGSGTDGLLALGNALWVAAVDLEGTRTMLYPVTPDGALGAPLSLPRISALAAREDAVWWLTAGGQVSRVAAGKSAQPATIGESGLSLALAPDGAAWVSTGTEIVRLEP
jgi:hypothetical protein